MGNQRDFSIPAFVDCGYMGLYGGLTTKDSGSHGVYRISSQLFSSYPN